MTGSQSGLLLWSKIGQSEVQSDQQTGVEICVDLVRQLPVDPVRPEVLPAAAQNLDDPLLFDQHVDDFACRARRLCTTGFIPWPRSRPQAAVRR